MTKRLSHLEEIEIVTAGERAAQDRLGMDDNPYTSGQQPHHNLWEWGRQHGLQKFCRAKERAAS